VDEDFAGLVKAALALSRELGGARVTISAGVAPDVAAALGREIRAGLDGPGLPLAVSAVAVSGDPPRIDAITVTAFSADEDDHPAGTCRGNGDCTC
jgi:hypothetical protein